MKSTTLLEAAGWHCATRAPKVHSNKKYMAKTFINQKMKYYIAVQHIFMLSSVAFFSRCTGCRNLPSFSREMASRDRMWMISIRKRFFFFYPDVVMSFGFWFRFCHWLNVTDWLRIAGKGTALCTSSSTKVGDDKVPARASVLCTDSNRESNVEEDFNVATTWWSGWTFFIQKESTKNKKIVDVIQVHSHCLQ